MKFATNKIKKQTKKKQLSSHSPKAVKKNYSTFGGIFAYYPFIRPSRRRLQHVYRFRRNNRFPDEKSIVSILALSTFLLEMKKKREKG